MHSRGIVHLDIKPSNILVTYDAGAGMCARDGEWLPEVCALTGVPSLDAQLRERVAAEVEEVVREAASAAATAAATATATAAAASSGGGGFPVGEPTTATLGGGGESQNLAALSFSMDNYYNTTATMGNGGGMGGDSQDFTGGGSYYEGGGGAGVGGFMDGMAQPSFSQLCVSQTIPFHFTQQHQLFTASQATTGGAGGGGGGGVFPFPPSLPTTRQPPRTASPKPWCEDTFRAGVWNAPLPRSGLTPSRLAACGTLVYKLGDLGQAVMATESDPFEGDSRYLAAELMEGNAGDLAATDIFALGMSLYELACGVPLPRGGAFYHALRTEPLPRPLEGPLSTAAGHSDFYALLSAMTHLDPSKRPSTATILSQPWLLLLTPPPPPPALLLPAPPTAQQSQPLQQQGDLLLPSSSALMPPPAPKQPSSSSASSSSSSSFSSDAAALVALRGELEEKRARLENVGEALVAAMKLLKQHEGVRFTEVGGMRSGTGGYGSGSGGGGSNGVGEEEGMWASSKSSDKCGGGGGSGSGSGGGGDDDDASRRLSTSSGVCPADPLDLSASGIGGVGGGRSGGSRGDREALPLASPPFTLHSLATPSSVEEEGGRGGEGPGVLLLPSDLPKKFSGGVGRLKASAAPHPAASVTSVMTAIQGALELCGMGSSGLNNT